MCRFCLHMKGKQTDVIISTKSTNAHFNCSSYACRRYGASSGLLWTTRLCDPLPRRGVCHCRTGWDRFALQCLRSNTRTTKGGVQGVLYWRHHYRGVVSAVCANWRYSVSYPGDILGDERILALRSLSQYPDF